jgi:hypothetical protein
MDILAMTQSNTQRPVAVDMEQIRIKYTGTWKVRSLNTGGALKGAYHQLSAYKVDIVTLQEKQCTDSGILHPLLWL